jgi:hypothetical protein
LNEARIPAMGATHRAKGSEPRTELLRKPIYAQANLKGYWLRLFLTDVNKLGPIIQVRPDPVEHGIRIKHTENVLQLMQ